MATGSGAVVAWGGGSTALAQELQREGARIVCWPGADPAPLEANGLAHHRVEELLSAADLEACAAVSRSWARVWARLPIAESRSFRDLASWRGESLLWACEGFLWQKTAAARCAATAELCLRLLCALQPAEVDACALPEADTLLLSRAATVNGVLFHGEARCRRALAVECEPAPRSVLGRLFGGSARPVRAAGASPGEGVVVLVSPDPGVPGLEPALQSEGLGLVRVDLRALESVDSAATPRAAATCQALRALHASLAGTPALAASYSHRGVVFHDLAADDIAALLLRRLPLAVRRLEQVLELLQQEGARYLLVDTAVAEEPRLFGLAARVAGLPWAVLFRQGGPEPVPERADGGPQPAFTFSLGPEPAAPIVERLRGTLPARAGVTP